MLWGVYSLYVHPATSPHTLPQRRRSLLGGPHPSVGIWDLQTWGTFPSGTRTMRKRVPVNQADHREASPLFAVYFCC